MEERACDSFLSLMPRLVIKSRSRNAPLPVLRTSFPSQLWTRLVPNGHPLLAHTPRETLFARFGEKCLVGPFPPQYPTVCNGYRECDDNGRPHEGNLVSRIVTRWSPPMLQCLARPARWPRPRIPNACQVASLAGIHSSAQSELLDRWSNHT